MYKSVSTRTRHAKWNLLISHPKAMRGGVGHWNTCAGLEKYTRNERERCKTTLETSREDVKLHSKRVGKM